MKRGVFDLLAYLSGLTVTQGRHAGRLLQVQPFQRRFVRGAFAPGIESAALSIARGSGKTTLLAGVACAHLDGPLAVPRGEVIIAAGSFNQARIAFEHCIAFMGPKLDDRKRWKVWDTAQQARIEDRVTGASIKCIGSDAKRAQGLAPVLVLADEPQAFAGVQGEKLMIALRGSAGKQPHFRFIALGVKPDSPQHWFSKMLAGKNCQFVQEHSAKPDDPPFRRRTWKKANPGLDHLPDIEASIRTEAEEAKRDPSALSRFLTYRLNSGTSDVPAENLLVTADVLRECEGDVPRGGDAFVAYDLGASAAMSAASCFWPMTGRLECFAAFPDHPMSLGERGLRDGVGNLYRQMASRNELLLHPGRVTSPQLLVDEAFRRWGQPVSVSADDYKESELLDALDACDGLTSRYAWHPRRQGYYSGGQDVRAFRNALLTHQVKLPPNLLLRSALVEAKVLVDTNDNAKLAKGHEAGRRLRARDDAAAASIMCIAEASRTYRPRAEGDTMRVVLL